MKGVSVSGFGLTAPPLTAELAVVKEERVDVAEEGLELGLSLGGGGGGGGGGSWEYCRILTAKDLPAIRSRSSPRSSNSSVSSSSPSPACGGVGTKRAAESAVDAVGSTSPPSQMVVGWPPIRAFRMNTMVSSQCIRENEEASKDTERKPVAASSRFVKVNMDGDPIGRKVDLNAHNSYRTLSVALEIMFQRPTTVSSYGGKVSKLLEGSSEFALTYEDKDGDWMLVGDVPWGMFLDTVKRLRIMRTSDASGLAPRFQPSDETSGAAGSKHI